MVHIVKQKKSPWTLLLDAPVLCFSNEAFLPFQNHLLLWYLEHCIINVISKSLAQM